MVATLENQRGHQLTVLLDDDQGEVFLCRGIMRERNKETFLSLTLLKSRWRVIEVVEY